MSGTEQETTNHCTKNEVFYLDFFCKWDQICSFLRIWSHLLRKSLVESLIFCAKNKLGKNKQLSSNQPRISLKLLEKCSKSSNWTFHGESKIHTQLSENCVMTLQTQLKSWFQRGQIWKNQKFCFFSCSIYLSRFYLVVLYLGT